MPPHLLSFWFLFGFLLVSLEPNQKESPSHKAGYAVIRSPLLLPPFFKGFYPGSNKGVRIACNWQCSAWVPISEPDRPNHQRQVAGCFCFVVKARKRSGSILVCPLNKQTWIASCCFFPSTLPQKPATVIEKNSNFHQFVPQGESRDLEPRALRRASQGFHQGSPGATRGGRRPYSCPSNPSDSGPRQSAMRKVVGLSPKWVGWML